jgi:hypothetical protein
MRMLVLLQQASLRMKTAFWPQVEVLKGWAQSPVQQQPFQTMETKISRAQRWLLRAFLLPVDWLMKTQKWPQHRRMCAAQTAQQPRQGR